MSKENFHRWFDDLIRALIANRDVIFSTRMAGEAAWNHQQKKIDALEKIIIHEYGEELGNKKIKECQ